MIDDLRELGNRILDDVRATEDQKREARKLMEALRDETPATIDRVEKSLLALRDFVERRGPLNTPAHEAVLWATLTSPLSENQSRWEKRARWQFAIGVAIIPIALATVVGLALTMPREMFTLIVLSQIVVLAFAFSYVVLRVHQQASVAAERMAEKRAGLTFLRIVLEQYGHHEHVKLLLVQGTQMFLGHHAPSTLVLGPEDFAAVTQVLARKSKEKGSPGE